MWSIFGTAFFEDDLDTRLSVQPGQQPTSKPFVVCEWIIGRIDVHAWLQCEHLDGLPRDFGNQRRLGSKGDAHELSGRWFKEPLDRDGR